MTRGGMQFDFMGRRSRIGMRAKRYREQELARFDQCPTASKHAPVLMRVVYVEGSGWFTRDELTAEVRDEVRRSPFRKKLGPRAWYVGPIQNKVWGSIQFAKVDLEISQLRHAHFLMTRDVRP